MSELIVKKRRPINKKEARSIKEGILSTHNLEMPISAGKFEIGKTDNFDVFRKHKCHFDHGHTVLFDE